MATRKWTPKALRAEADRIERRERTMKGFHEKRESRLYTVSHMIMAGIMAMYFVGVVLGVYATVRRGEPVIITLNYIKELAQPVAIGYFVKAFGENIAKIVLSYIFGVRGSGTSDNDEEGGVSG